MWDSRTSSLNDFNARRADTACISKSEQSVSASTIFSMASIWPLILRKRTTKALFSSPGRVCFIEFGRLLQQCANRIGGYALSRQFQFSSEALNRIKRRPSFPKAARVFWTCSLRMRCRGRSRRCGRRAGVTGRCVKDDARVVVVAHEICVAGLELTDRRHPITNSIVTTNDNFNPATGRLNLEAGSSGLADGRILKRKLLLPKKSESSNRLAQNRDGILHQLHSARDSRKASVDSAP